MCRSCALRYYNTVILMIFDGHENSTFFYEADYETTTVLKSETIYCIFSHQNLQKNPYEN